MSEEFVEHLQTHTVRSTSSADCLDGHLQAQTAKEL